MVNTSVYFKYYESGVANNYFILHLKIFASVAIYIYGKLLLHLPRLAVAFGPRDRKPSFWRQVMKRIAMASAMFLSVLALSACGSSTSDRALSGAAIGAGTGAVGGALLGSPLTGALIGGAVGAGAGALTDESDINLGKPIWR
jgi:hypothetical protein